MPLLFQLVEGTLDLLNLVADVGQKSRLLHGGGVSDVKSFEKGIGVGGDFGLRGELRRKLEHFQNVLVCLVAEVAVQVELEGHYGKDQVLVVQEVFDCLVFDEVELELEEISLAETRLLSFQDDRIGLPAQLVIDLEVRGLNCNFLVF